ncbi:HD-GYP domain-containing protein [Clostridium tagluense]|uniref:HD-GYP domain-containing protein n=1 Tax=Clostridium tagluense TaxID=360422 RepID=UPI001C6E3DA7|nr:HD-GYP domain-containing protein [Clostridium tagluense]MBW9156783.1 HD-GYP domain-containing protein [Clostridium tagluense]WLC66266.1 HD-GYP domain-containing protein [Clostridium tagluense]
MKKLPLNLKIYIITIYIITFISFLVFFKIEYIIFSSIEFDVFIFFIFLTTLTESLTVIYRKISFSTSFAITVASFLLFNTFNAIIILVLGFLFRLTKDNNKYKHIFNTPFYGTLFNCCGFTLPILYGSYFYKLVGGTIYNGKLDSNLLPIIVFGIVFYIINTFIISIVFSITNKKGILYSFLGNFKLVLLNTFAMTPFGILLAYIFNLYSYAGVILVLFPIVLARYTFSLYIQSKSQYVQTVDALMLAMEARDKYTEGHSKRVAEISANIAKELKYNDWKIEQLNMAALLHDVGKIGINDEILNKPGKLSTEEFDIIKTHPLIGYNILKDIKNLENVLPIIRNHHEQYDGNGYPDGKKVEELSLDVFIVQLADSIDAMSTDRPYRKALNHDMVIEEVKKYSGTQFHPKVVAAYFKVPEKQKSKVRI